MAALKLLIESPDTSFIWVSVSIDCLFSFSLRFSCFFIWFFNLIWQWVFRYELLDLIKPPVLVFFLWHCSCSKGGVLICYCHLGIEVYVPHSATTDIWREWLLISAGWEQDFWLSFTLSLISPWLEGIEVLHYYSLHGLHRHHQKKCTLLIAITKLFSERAVLFPFPTHRLSAFPYPPHTLIWPFV